MPGRYHALGRSGKERLRRHRYAELLLLLECLGLEKTVRSKDVRHEKLYSLGIL